MSNLAVPDAATAGAVAVEEYAYGLGPPTGILVLRYPPAGVAVDFPDGRNDFVHQVFWSPDGVLGVRRGATTTYLGRDDALWLRRGAAAEIASLGSQTVLRVCLRAVPDELAAQTASTVTVTPDAREALLSIARPGVSEGDGLRGRRALLDGLAAVPGTGVDHRATDSPAQQVAAALLRDPSDPTSLAAWARLLHVSTKTLQRHFDRDFGTSFLTWRTRTRLLAARHLLCRLTVTETAHRVGYASASSFIAAYSREFGEPPGRARSERM